MTIIEQLVTDIFDDTYYQSLYEKSVKHAAEINIGKSEPSVTFEDNELSDILRYADILSNSSDQNARNHAYQIVTNLNRYYREVTHYQTVSKAVYSKLGNFPAVSYVDALKGQEIYMPLDRFLEFEAKKQIQAVPFTEEGFVFTDVQYELYSNLTSFQEFSFSGPTSMGKSFIIKTFIRSVMENTPPENLLIVVPTRALINQFALDLKKELFDALGQFNYRILTNSSTGDLEEEVPHHYIFILTPERLISYLSQDSNPPIGFVFVDEAHKLAQQSDSRSVTTYTAIERLIKKYTNVKLYFSSPNVSNPEVFLRLFNRQLEGRTFNTSESPVSQNLFFVDLFEKKMEAFQKDLVFTIDASDILENVESTVDLINTVGKNQNNLVYCNSKASTIDTALAFSSERLPNASAELNRAIRQIREYIHPDYYLVEVLKKGVAFHYGKLPQLIRNLVEDLYKNEIVKNVFCTSTLLEGVNMPTQNIFILNNMNGRKTLSPIDFWNLSGRAGRLMKELYGNIYCVRHEGCDWEDRNILIKDEITLNPTVTSKVERNFRKIEKVLREQRISGSEEEKAILRYIANIISVDTLELDEAYRSPLIDKLIEKNRNTILELAKGRVKDFVIPKDILGSNQSIDLSSQNDVFKRVSEMHQRGENVKLPSGKLKYEAVHMTLLKMYDLYSWKNAEKKISNQRSLRYYAFILNQWVNGISLSQIIRQSLEYYLEQRMSVPDGYGPNGLNYVPFQPGNKKHVNTVIEGIIEDIEYVLRFLFEKYFNHYFLILERILGEGNAGENWATLLEYGTQNRIVIALQNLGLSRHTAIVVSKKHRSALTVQDGKLVSVNKQMILNALQRRTLVYYEVDRML